MNLCRLDGKRHLAIAHIVSVGRVRSRAYAHDLLQIDYADAQKIVTVYFGVAYRSGGAETIDRLFGMIETLRSEAPLSIEPEVIEKHREKVLEDQASFSRQATRFMWVGAAMLLAGLVVTIGTYARATSAGGVYVIAWGAIVGGLSVIVRGYTMGRD